MRLRSVARTGDRPGGVSVLLDPVLVLVLLVQVSRCKPLSSTRTEPEASGEEQEPRRGQRGSAPFTKTTPFVLVDRARTRLADTLQVRAETSSVLLLGSWTRTGFKDGHPERLQFGLQVRGEVYLLDLEKNHDLLPRPPNIFYYLPNGTGVSAESQPVTQCYYHGTVRGFPQSTAALSTCSGIRGVVVLNSTLSFEVKPDERMEDLHLLLPIWPLEGTACGVSQSEGPPVHAVHSVHTVHRTKRDILSETKYIELVLVADHQEFLNHQQNNQTLIYRLMDIANQVDWFYRPLKVRVALTGLEIWSDRDKILVKKNPAETLSNFLDWRSRQLLPRLRHDNAQLLMGGAFQGSTVGMASQSSMCSRDRSGGVNVDHLVSVLGVASTVAHELGHNLGMNHDSDERSCRCNNEARLGGCIMEPSTGLFPGQQFSSCSATDLSTSLLQGGGMCLFNHPQPESIMGGPQCGNLYLEQGEECDCGLLEECDDPCCNASTCTLQPGAQCSSEGGCCEDCKFRPAGWACRRPLGECDLPEFCSGSSAFCPSNVFLQNGHHCLSGASYCYEGVCAGLDQQCQRLWGANATQAPPLCFSSVNKQGNKHGNCGQNPNGSYIPCSSADVLCGRLQCQGGGERPVLGSGAEILTTKVQFNHSDLQCRGTFLDLGDDVSDPATVAQGTACGPHSACLDRRCQDISIFQVDECRTKCNGRGVCNSNRACHCDLGRAPPDCLKPGPGGSRDSGPASTAADPGPGRVALLVVFLFVIPVFLLFLVLRFPRCRGNLVLDLFSKTHSRAPVSDYDQDTRGPVLPLRYQWSHQTDAPLTSTTNKIHDRPAPPTKPLPPDPELKALQVPVPPKALAHRKPPPPDPPTQLYHTGYDSPQHGGTGSPSLPRRCPPHPPLPPSRPTPPRKPNSSSPI